MLDPSLEATAANGQSNPNWSSTSSNFGTVFCAAGLCPNDGSNPAPRTGAFYAWFGVRVKLGNTVLRSFSESAATESAYLQRSVDLSAFANGQSQSIEFEYSNPAGSGVSNFLIDDLALECAPAGS